uniref:Putative interferon-related developmental regulator 1 n=1 Tax=Davidia involucrata TaxID=16924 RepID=A0A5B6YNU7_DAVIN
MANRSMKPRGGRVPTSTTEPTQKPKSKPKSLELLLEELFSKRGPTREEALSKIIEAFTEKMQHEFAENLFATLLHRCENCIKRGSAKEICLASQAIGLLAITIGYGDEAHEIYRDSVLTLSQALKSGPQTIRILECLAIVTFVGAEDFEDTERSMKIIWQFIYPGSDSNVGTNKHSAPVLAAAISAWSFLLTTMDGWRLDHKYWKGVIPYFSKLLEENESTRDVVIEALSLIFEKGFLEKFTSQATDSIHKEVSNFFEDESRLEMSINICGNALTFLTRCRLKKINFLKRFLGDGFVKHMLENELLHSVFDFTPKNNHHPDSQLYISENEEVTKRVFLPEVRKTDSFQRMYKSPNSILSKARTQLLKKKRMLAQMANEQSHQEEKGYGEDTA